MANEHRYQTDRELARALEALAPRLRFPETPDLAGNVRARIDIAPVPLRPRWQPGRFAALAATLVILIVAGALALPAGRGAVAEWFDLPGVTLFTSGPDEPAALGGALRLGEPVTLAAAREQAAFAVLVPDGRLGDPDEVYFDRRPIGGAVSFVYHADDDLPAIDVSGVGLLLTQVQGELNPGIFGKGVPDGVALDVLEINGATAFWLSGDPHPFYYMNPEGEIIEETRRLAGNTLIWQAGDLTLRLESALDRDAAIALAETMR